MNVPKFRALVRLDGKTATGIEVPAETMSALGASKRPVVSVTINGFTYRSTVGTMGGRHLLPVSAEARSKAAVEAGDQVTVELALDLQPRTVDVPAALAAALASEPAAHRAFDALSYSAQRRHVLAVDGAKLAATRQRRVDAIVNELLASHSPRKT
jgi:Bacteriocin-protection, YdeI or OmpD-Associated/Domain of unknown function (DUF1905)